MSKYLLTVVALVLAFLLGVLAYAQWDNTRVQQTSHSDASIFVEQIKDVLKLVTVEGSISEIYNETRTKEVTLYLPLPTTFKFDKKAMVQVTGKVLVGYDLESMSIDVDEHNKTITISNLPKPEILAIDHNLAYTNIEESWFNNFTAKDYTALNYSAKSLLKQKAENSELMAKAKNQGADVIRSIQLLAEGAGLELIINDTSTTEKTDSEQIFKVY